MARWNKQHKTDHVEFGIMMVLIGCAAMAYKMGYLPYKFTWWELAASFAAVLGAVRLLLARSLYQVISALFQIGVAGLFYAMFEHLWDLDFRVHWPLFLIAFGLSSILKYAARPKDDNATC